MPPFTIRRTSATVPHYVEPIEGLDNELIPLTMILVPGGSFLMGSPKNEPERRKNEVPQLEVTVPSFFMGCYPVTQGQWREVARLKAVNRRIEDSPSKFNGPNRPVEQVNWYEAVEFCQRLARETKRPYRLPSEAEWEYACRAGTTTPFSFGKTLTVELANYDARKSYNGGLEGKYRRETTPVGQFEVANAFGLSDMHGNVFEWCQDKYHSSYEGAPTDGSAWGVGGEGKYAVLRGGSWSYDPRYCRSASRISDQPDNRNYNLGFRVVSLAPRALQ